MAFIESLLKKNKNLDMTSGHQTYDFNHINDVIDGLIECLIQKENKVSHKNGT